MKKLFSITFALLILLSGMNLTITTHICGRQVEAVKWSFTGKKANCGMKMDKETCPAKKGISANCCQDRMTVYKVDNNYKPSTYQSKEVTKKYLHTFATDLITLFNSHNSYVSNNGNVIPPDIALTSAVYLPEICVFRI